MFLRNVQTKGVLVFIGSFIFSVIADPAVLQLPKFKNRTTGPIGFMTTSNGAKIELSDTTVLNSPLIFNEYFMDAMTSFVRERTLNRVVHAKGAGAFGYFIVTHDVTDICKAKLFSGIGKKTRVAVRFSSTILDKGGPDTGVNSRGMAVKFYTEDGNFDMVGFSSPMFTIKDPSVLPSLFRSLRPNPATNLFDVNALSDFITLRPETVFFFMYVFSDYGMPTQYKHMPGFSIHTYQIYNEKGQSFFVRFHLIPDQGVKNMVVTDAIRLTAKDRDYFVRGLYESIDSGERPSWTVYFQVLTLEDVRKAEFDVFDITKILPIEKYPLRPVGKIVLNQNPKNYFAEVEQLAFGPNNVVPGILGSPDKMFESRRFAYRDAHLYRLGANFNRIQVNCPFSSVLTYNRDGVAPVGFNGEDAPNYYPNSFNGPIPYKDKKRPKLISVMHDYSYNFDQADDMYKNMTEGVRNRLVGTLVSYLGKAEKSLQTRVVQIFSEINEDFGRRTAAALAVASAVTN